MVLSLWRRKTPTADPLAGTYPPPAVIPNPSYDLDHPVLTFADGSEWLLRDLFQHVHVFGEPGSGKSSGSLATLYRICARNMGMLCLTAKEDEPGRLIKMALQAGRPEQDIIIIDDQLKWRFNFLDYEMKRRGGGDTFTIVETLLSMVEAKRRQQSGSSGDEAPFWRDAAHEALTHCINVLRLSQGTLRLADIHQYFATMPRTQEQLVDTKFTANSFAFKQLAEAMERSEKEGLGNEAELAYYHMQQIAGGDPRTAGNVLITITSMLQPFLSGKLHELFCTETNWTPELVLEEGKLTIIAFPVLLYKQLGVLAQVIFKAAFAQACGARRDDEHSIPVVLYADEAQSFYTEDDNRLAEMGRSKRVAMIYGTQNTGNYVRALGGSNAKEITEALLGNFGTLFFHSNKHPGTNRFASEIIGRSLTTRYSVSASIGRSRGTNESVSETTTRGKSWSWSSAFSWGRSRGKSKGRSEGFSSSTGGGHSNSTENPNPMAGTYSGNWSEGSNTSYNIGENISTNEGGNAGQSYSLNESRSYGTSRGVNHSTNEGSSSTATQHMDVALEPAVFVSQLRTGGRRHDFTVDAVVIQGGRIWNDGKNWTIASFRQE